MTADEFGVVLKGIRALYPRDNVCPDDESKTIWFRMLKDLDYRLCQAAVMKHASICKYSPTIAEIRTQAAQLTQTGRKDWLEGWGMVQKTIHDTGMHRPQEAFEKLRQFDERTARVAEMMGWQSLCTSENPVADRANFRQCYEALQSREAEASKLPPAVSKLVSQISADLKPLLEGKK